MLQVVSRNYTTNWTQTVLSSGRMPYYFSRNGSNTGTWIPTSWQRRLALPAFWTVETSSMLTNGVRQDGLIADSGVPRSCLNQGKHQSPKPVAAPYWAGLKARPYTGAAVSQLLRCRS